MPRKKATTRKRSTHGSVKLREKRLKNGDTSFYLDIYTGKGQRQYEFLKLFTIPDNEEHNREVRLRAMELRNEREREVIAGTYGETPVHVQREEFLPFFEAITDTKTSSSWRSTRKHLTEFIKERKASPTFGTINKQFCEEFQTYLLAKVSHNTAHTYYMVYCTALNVAVKRGKLPKAPHLQAERLIEKQETQREFLTLDELRLLRNTPCPNKEVGNAFLFCCFVGLRYSDVYRLDWENVNDDAIRIRVKKTGKPLAVPLNATARQFLPDREREGKIFKLPSHCQANNVLVRWCQKAGITKNVTFHIARHSFAINGLANDIDVFTLSALLGHSDVRTTKIYARVLDNAKASALDRLSL